MTDGLLHRPGRLHSQRMSATAQVVLRDPRLRDARSHYGKAQKYFAKSPEADYPNSVKEAVSSLESACKALFSSREAGFEKCLRGVTDGDGDPIPPTILKGLLSVYQFRGAGEGIAHGGATGGRPTAAVTEWVLSVVASSIIYLRDLSLSLEDETPPF